MNKCHALTIICIIISCSCIAKPAHDSQFYDSGWIHIRGRLVNGTCSVTTNTKDMLIDLDSFTPTTGKLSMLVSSPNSFSLSINSCDTTLSKNIGITFSGNRVPFMPMLLQTSMLGTSSLGPGLAFFYDNDKKIVINGKPIHLAYINPENREMKISVVAVPLFQQYLYSNIRSFISLDLIYP